MDFVVNTHSNAASRRKYLWEIDLRFAPGLPPGWYLTQSVCTVVLQKSTPPRIRQLFLYYCLYEKEGDGFACELTFAKRL